MARINIFFTQNGVPFGLIADDKIYTTEILSQVGATKITGETTEVPVYGVTSREVPLLTLRGTDSDGVTHTASVRCAVGKIPTALSGLIGKTFTTTKESTETDADGNEDITETEVTVTIDRVKLPRRIFAAA